MIKHGDWIEGYGSVTGLYHKDGFTVYICFDGSKYNYFKRPL